MARTRTSQTPIVGRQRWTRSGGERGPAALVASVAAAVAIGLLALWSFYGGEGNSDPASPATPRDPADVAEAVLSLITGSDLITGQVLPVEGGVFLGS